MRQRRGLGSERAGQVRAMVRSAMDATARTSSRTKPQRATRRPSAQATSADVTDDDIAAALLCLAACAV